jgi:cytochrome o ubiquinol oxidase subunit 2
VTTFFRSGFVTAILPRGAIGLTLVSLLSGCHLEGILDPGGSVGSQEMSLITTSTIAMLIVVIPVIILTGLFVWRYRASNTSATYAPNWSHSTAIEIAIWSIPALIVLFLAIITWTSTHKLDPYRPLASNLKPVEVEAVSMDWKWLFIYPDLGIASVNELAIPTGTPVNFHITSDTVMNSFFIPRLGTQIYSMAGMITQLHLIADKAGEYDGMSANFSGPGFSDMNFQTLAMSQSDFDQWVQKVRAAPTQLNAAAYKQLAVPSTATQVGYYSSVTPAMFAAVVNEHGGMQMQAPAKPVAPAAMSMSMQMSPNMPMNMPMTPSAPSNTPSTEH